MSSSPVNHATNPGLFLSFEGGEGCGKSTQSFYLVNALREAGFTAIRTREPGGTEIGEALRQWLVTNAGKRWIPMAELLLFQSLRAQHLAEIIEPALQTGTIVICDRYVDSTRVYQGMVQGVGLETVDALHALSVQNRMPHLTFLLDIDPSIGLQRASHRGESLTSKTNETRYEMEKLEFHLRVREGFLFLAAQNPCRIVSLDASRSEHELHAAILRHTLDFRSQWMGPSE